MSLLHHPYDARLFMPSLRRMVERTGALVVMWRRRRPQQFLTEEMPDRVLYDIGLRDSRTMTARRNELG